MECVTGCPADAFREGEHMLYIDPDECTDCYLCSQTCPVEAIFHDSDVPADWLGFIALNAEMAQQCPVITAPQ
jgi:ferredoxin